MQRKIRKWSIFSAILFTFSAFIQALSFFQPVSVLAADSSTQTIVFSGSLIDASVINYDGHDLGADAYIMMDGVKYPAYCVDPMLPGAHKHPNGEYPVNFAGTNNNPKVATVLHNTVPYKSREEVLAQFPGLSDLQIYAATKAAIRAVADQSAGQYLDTAKWRGNTQTVMFARHLINLAKNATEDMPELAIYGNTGLTPVTEEGEYFVRSTLVQSYNYPLADGKKIKLTLPPEAPAGTVIAYEDGTPIPAEGVDNFTTVKVMVPKSAVPEGASGSFDVAAEMYIYSGVILFGEPANAGDVGKFQRYEISMPVQKGVFSFPMEYTGTTEVDPSITPTPGVTQKPEPTPEPKPDVGGVKIAKYDNVTGRLAPDAIFEIKGLDDGNSEIKIQAQASSGARQTHEYIFWKKHDLLV